jgi:predicted nucleotidyltransferase/DNA-binding transcriptional regulator YiaG
MTQRPDPQISVLPESDPAARVIQARHPRRIAMRQPVAWKDLTAGALLRRARRDAGLSQVELAARAGVTQSVVSAYESGRRQPSLPTLAALVDAAGHELVTDVRRQPRRLSRLSGPVGRRVRRRRHELVAAAAAHGASGLRVFGSVARGQDRSDSDVDLLADLPTGMSLFGLARLQADLESILGTRVDLVPAADLKPDVRSRVERDLVAL